MDKDKRRVRRNLVAKHAKKFNKSEYHEPSQFKHLDTLHQGSIQVYEDKDNEDEVPLTLKN